MAACKIGLICRPLSLSRKLLHGEALVIVKNVSRSERFTRYSRHGKAFSISSRFCEQQQHRKESFSSRLRTALRNTKVQWYPIPVGLGIGFLGLAHLYRLNQRRVTDEEDEEDRAYLKSTGHSNGDKPAEEHEDGRRPKRRKRIRPDGPWCVMWA